MATPLDGMTDEQFDQWVLNTDRRLNDLELYVFQLVDQNKKLDARVKALEQWQSALETGLKPGGRHGEAENSAAQKAADK
jgi:hypothetical protein